MQLDFFTADAGTGSARKKRSQRYIRTAGGSEASAESACCASVASESNEASPTCTKPKSCEEPTCGGTTTSSNGCSFMPVRSILAW